MTTTHEINWNELSREALLQEIEYLQDRRVNRPELLEFMYQATVLLRHSDKCNEPGWKQGRKQWIEQFEKYDHDWNTPS